MEIYEASRMIFTLTIKKYNFIEERLFIERLIILD